MVIEFVGPSGAGKTTAVLAVLRAAPGLVPGRRSLMVERRARAATLFARTALALTFLPGLLIRLRGMPAHLRELWGNCSGRERLSVLLAACQYAVCARSRDTFIYDQGLVQELANLTRYWTGDFTSENLPRLYHAVGRRSLPDIVFYFRTDARLVMQRTKMDSSRFRDPDDIRRTMDSQDAHLRFLRTRLGVRVIHVDATRDAAEVVQQVIPKIVNHHPSAAEHRRPRAGMTANRELE